jgi:hypothetical protein
MYLGINYSDGRNLLIASHYFSHVVKVDTIKNYFNLFFRKCIRYLDNHVLLLGDFKVLGFDWNYGLLSLALTFRTKLKSDVNHSAICFLV